MIYLGITWAFLVGQCNTQARNSLMGSFSSLCEGYLWDDLKMSTEKDLNIGCIVISLVLGLELDCQGGLFTECMFYHAFSKNKKNSVCVCVKNDEKSQCTNGKSRMQMNLVDAIRTQSILTSVRKGTLSN